MTLRRNEEIRDPRGIPEETARDGAREILGGAKAENAADGPAGAAKPRKSFPAAPLFLGGFMASGKSTVGPILAERLGVPFLDADDLIEQRAGISAAEIFAREGEEAFRRREAEVIEELLALRGLVAALGGGALTNPELRRRIRQGATLAILSVSAETALLRGGAPGSRPRPLLDPTQVSSLLASRAEAYASGHLTVDTDRLSPEEVARRILEGLPEATGRGDLLIFCRPQGTATEEGMPPEARPLIAPVGGKTKRTAAPTDPVSPFHVFPTEGRFGGSLPEILDARGVPSAMTAETGGALIGRGLLGQLEEILPGETPYLVSDELVGPLYAPRVGRRRGLALLPRGEAAKTLERVRDLYEAFAEAGLDRGSRVIALGGGTVGDSAGFAAATWMRGIDLIQCPTTLLAMVDSSLGGKVGVDLPRGKNLVGAFHRPVASVMDVDCLSTQSEEEFRQGLAEAVKYGFGEDPDFLLRFAGRRASILARDPVILAELVRDCARMKLAVVAEDERETGGARARLNLGHTVAHGLEAASGYDGWKHGDAVAVGLATVLILGTRLGTCGKDYAREGIDLIRSLGLPARPDRSWEEIRPFLLRDKKFRYGRPRLVIPREGTRCELREVPLEELHRAYEELAQGTP
jgi:3-dehydroquinate synthetase/shikimate kinase